MSVQTAEAKNAGLFEASKYHVEAAQIIESLKSGGSLS
jgi:hypothetical protein